MLRKVRFRRPSATTAIALLALFLATGSSSALASFIIGSNSQVGPGTISGHHPPSGDHANIIGGSIASGDLANGAVSTGKLTTGAVTEGKVAAAIKDGAANLPSLRTLGTGALQAMPGNATPGGPPTGTAGGDMTGTYPNPTVDPTKVQARVTASCSSGSAISSINQDGTVGCNGAIGFTNGSTLGNGGSYLVISSAHIINQSNSAALVGECSVVTTPPASQNNPFPLPQRQVDGAFASAPGTGGFFTYTGIVTTAEAGDTLSLECFDTSGNNVSPVSVSWRFAPVTISG